MFIKLFYYGFFFFFFSSRRRHTRFDCDWSSDVCSSDLFRATHVAIQLTLRAFDELEDPTNKIIMTWMLWYCCVYDPWFCIQIIGCGMRSEERRVGKECRFGR